MIERQAVARGALNLVLAIYRVTDKLPRGEILIWQMRKLANETMGDLTLGNLKDTERKFNLLLFYFQIASSQNWVKEINWLILEKECRRLKEEIASLILGQGEASDDFAEKADIFQSSSESQGSIMSHNINTSKIDLRSISTRPGLSERQRKILSEVQSKKSLKISDLTPLFKNQTSERTLRNDLRFLLDEGLIAKKGSNKFMTYLSE